MAQDVFISYDISGRHALVKQGMIGLGYLDYWTYENKLFYLPNTCLWKKNIEFATAYEDITSIINNLNNTRTVLDAVVVLERYISTKAFPWYGIPGEPR